MGNVQTTSLGPLRSGLLALLIHGGQADLSMLYGTSGWFCKAENAVSMAEIAGRCWLW